MGAFKADFLEINVCTSLLIRFREFAVLKLRSSWSVEGDFDLSSSEPEIPIAQFRRLAEIRSAGCMMKVSDAAFKVKIRRQPRDYVEREV